jgi:beta-1,4-mannosyl-glycoprotein beta-1,4-N-acetylglucosaminyltransferase
MKVYDCFPFNNEIDLLDFRLRTYWDRVDFFVISESTFAFDGSRKPLYAAKFIKENFPNSEKIRLVEYCPTEDILSKLPKDRWPIEKFARQSLATGFADALENDIIILSDADEFPSFEQIADGINAKEVLSVVTPMFFRKANYLVAHSKQWRRCRIGPKALMLDLNLVRDGHYPVAKGLKGMHLSYLELGRQDVIEKHKTSAHAEISVGEEFIKEALRISDNYGVDHLGRVETLSLGLLKFLKVSELNDFQRLFLLSKPEYFNFQDNNHSVVRRISASLHLSNAWKNSDISILYKIDQLTFINLFRDLIVSTNIFVVVIAKIVIQKMRNLYNKAT